MTEKAKVTVRSAYGYKDYQLAPGDTLTIEATGIGFTHHTPAKGPQPEAVWQGNGTTYRWDKETQGFQQRWKWAGAGDPWEAVTWGDPGAASVDFMRFAMNLKEATLKWHAS